MFVPVLSDSAVVTLTAEMAFLWDKDGLLVHSEPHILATIIEAAAAAVGAKRFSEAELQEIWKCFGKPDDEMSGLLFGVLADLRYTLPVQRNEWVKYFVQQRAMTWKQKLRLGVVKHKPGALSCLKALQDERVPLGMYTSMPQALVAMDLEHLFPEFDFYDVVTCSDTRLHGQGKPSPRGWQVLIDSLQNPRPGTHRFIAVEDRASGAVGALEAGCELVVVVPDPSDVPRDAGPNDYLKLWDRRGFIQAWLERNPGAENASRLVFLPSLEVLRFKRG